MTNPDLTVDNSVVEALELAAKHDLTVTRCGFQDAAWLRKKATQAIPLAKRQAEAEAALKWLVKNYPAALRGCLSSDCPPTIKEMLGEGK